MRERGHAGPTSTTPPQRSRIGRRLRRVGTTTLALAIGLVFAVPATAQQDAAPWPMFDADAQGSGQGAVSGPSDPGLKWYLDLEQVETTDAPAGYTLADGQRMQIAGDGTMITRAENNDPQYDRSRFARELIGIDTDDGTVAWQIDDTSPNVSTRVCRPGIDEQNRVWVETRDDSGNYVVSAYDTGTGDAIAGTEVAADDQRCREHLLIGGSDQHLVFADGSTEGLRIFDISGGGAVEVASGIDITDASGLPSHGSVPAWGVFTDTTFITAVRVDDGQGRIDLVEISLADGSIVSQVEAPTAPGTASGDFSAVILVLDQSTDTLIASMRSGIGSSPGPIIAGLDTSDGLSTTWTHTDLEREPRDLTLADDTVLFQEGARTTAPGATLQGLSIATGDVTIEGLGAGTRPLTNPDGSGYTSWRTPDMTRDRLITGFSAQGDVEWTIDPGRIVQEIDGAETIEDLNMDGFASLRMASVGADGTLYVTSSGEAILAIDDRGGLTELICGESFVDVGPTDTHACNIDEMAARGITQGVGDDRFDPDGTVPREQFASFLVRALDDVEPTDSGPFDDVNPDSVHAPNIFGAAQAGITLGTTETTFAPERLITRAEVASLLARAFELDPVDQGPFDDVDSGNVHAGNINAVFQAGITTGVTDSTFEPDRTLNRAQMSSLLIRALDSVG